MTSTSPTHASFWTYRRRLQRSVTLVNSIAAAIRPRPSAYSAAGDDVEHADWQTCPMQCLRHDLSLYCAHFAQLDDRVQPTAIAATSLPQMKPASLFHGVMSPATPSGSITTSAIPTRRVKSYASSTCAMLSRTLAG
jgi:hypothetical protein